LLCGILAPRLRTLVPLW
jgi:hypothetical protein